MASGLASAAASKLTGYNLFGAWRLAHEAGSVGQADKNKRAGLKQHCVIGCNLLFAL